MPCMCTDVHAFNLASGQSKDMQGQDEPLSLTDTHISAHSFVLSNPISASLFTCLVIFKRNYYFLSSKDALN